MVAVNNLKRQKGKSSGIIRALASFIVIFLVTAFGASAITKMVHYCLVEDDMISYDYKGWDYVLSEFPENAKMYQALKEEIIADKGVEKVQEQYTEFWAGSVKNDVLSQEYWNAYRTIADLYYPGDLTDEEFQELISSERNQFCILGVNQETFEKIAEKSECDSELISDSSKPAVIVYQNGEVSTELYGFEGYKPEKSQFFELEHMTEKKIGDTIPLYVYSMEKEKEEVFDVTVAGYATKESLKDYATIREGSLWLIMNVDTVEKIQSIMNTSKDDNYNGISRRLCIKLNGTETDLVQRIKMLMDEEESTFWFTEVGEKSVLKTVGEAVAYIIKILAVCFIILTSFICVLNMYNSIWGRAVERQQEFAILTSLGMTKKQRIKMLLLENIGLFFKSVAWALAISLPAIYFLKTALSGFFGKVKLEFPYLLLVLAIGIAGMWLFWVTYYCYRSKEQETILEQMRNENVS